MPLRVELARWTLRAALAATLVVALITPVDARAAASSLYVDPAGVSGPCDNSRDLTVVQNPATPLCTVERAFALAPAGARIVLRTGVYPKVVLTGNAGREADVTIMPAPSESPQLGALALDRTSRVRVDGLRSGKVDIGGSASHVAITNSTLTGGVVLRAGARDVRLAGNDVSAPRGNAIIFSASATTTTVDNVEIRRNYFHDVGVAAVNARRFRSLEIVENEFERVRSWDGVVHADVIRTFAGGSGLVVRGNYIHDNAAIGFFIKDGRVSDVVFENNVVVGTQRHCAISIYYADRVAIRNNTVVDNFCGIVFAGAVTGVDLSNNLANGFKVSGSVTWLREDYNLFQTGAGTGTHTIRGGELFVNRAARDYRLAPGSAAIDAALSEGAPDADLVATPRADDPATFDRGEGPSTFYDIGAYELGAASVAPARGPGSVPGPVDEPGAPVAEPEPPAVEPPAVEPPAVEPPAVEPPAVEPPPGAPVDDPEPPAVEPPPTAPEPIAPEPIAPEPSLPSPPSASRPPAGASDSAAQAAAAPPTSIPLLLVQDGGPVSLGLVVEPAGLPAALPATPAATKRARRGRSCPPRRAGRGRRARRVAKRRAPSRRRARARRPMAVRDCARRSAQRQGRIGQHRLRPPGALRREPYS